MLAGLEREEQGKTHQRPAVVRGGKILDYVHVEKHDSIRRFSGVPGETGHSAWTRLGSLEDKKARRLRFLIELYDMVDGYDAQPVEVAAVASRLGLDATRPTDHLEVSKRVRYLLGEGLVAVHGDASGTRTITLTHKGVREAEQAMERPDLPTEHFPPLRTVTPETRNASLDVGNGATEELGTLAEPDRLEVLRLIQALKGWVDQLSLVDEQKAEFAADIRTIEAQLDSPNPKVKLILIALTSIRRTAAGGPSGATSASGIVASGIVSIVDRLLADL